MYLNSKLIKKQGLTKANVKRLQFLHAGGFNLRMQMKETDDVYLLRMFAKMITEIEFELQRTWKFPLAPAFHRFWELPKCTCPKLDNEERYPLGCYIISGSCPIHSN